MNKILIIVMALVFLALPLVIAVDNITIETPLNQTYNISTLDFNVSLNISGKAGSTCNFTIDSNETSVPMTKYNNTYFNYTNYTIVEGSFNITFGCNNTDDLWNTTETRYFFINLTQQVLTQQIRVEYTYSSYTKAFGLAILFIGLFYLLYSSLKQIEEDF